MKKRRGQKLLAIFITAMFLFSLAACTNTQNKEQTTIDTSKLDTLLQTLPEKKHYKIGIMQIVEHPALDAAKLAFIDKLDTQLHEKGKEANYEIQNAQGDQANCQTIANQFNQSDFDLILAIATPTAQAAANVITDVPILFTAVTDPIEAKLVNSIDNPGANLTGTSDLAPLEEQAKLTLQLDPNIKKVAICYNSSEANSSLQAKQIAEAYKKIGVETIDMTVSSSNEIQQVVTQALLDADALYIPTDNLFANAIGIINSLATAQKKIVINGEENQLIGGGLATIGIDYEKLGEQTADMATKILLEGQSPATLAVEYQKDTRLAINFEFAKAIGLEIPQELKEKAIDIH